MTEKDMKPFAVCERVLHVKQQAELPILHDYVMKDPTVTT